MFVVASIHQANNNLLLSQSQDHKTFKGFIRIFLMWITILKLWNNLFAFVSINCVNLHCSSWLLNEKKKYVYVACKSLSISKQKATWKMF
jgi:hypothetical protein